MPKIEIPDTCEPFMYNTYNDLNKFEIGDVVQVSFKRVVKKKKYSGKTLKFVVNNFMKHNWRRPTRRLALIPIELVGTDDISFDDILFLDDGDRFECLMIDLFPINRRPYAGWKNKTVKIKKIESEVLPSYKKIEMKKETKPSKETVVAKKAVAKKAPVKKVAKKVATKVEKEIPPSKPTNGINANMFDLTPEQMETSKMMYGGKIVKCLVAPYHVYATLEKIIPFTPTTYLFPEREMSTPQLKSLISMIVANKTATEFRIVTTNQNVIMDMVDDCVRVLTEYNEVVASPVKTFAANIHDIRYSLLENKDHQKSDVDKTESNKRISDLIDKVNDKKPITRAQYDSLYKEIDMIGEPIISNKLKEMLRDKDVLAIELEETNPSKIKFDKREIEWIQSKQWYKENNTVAKSLKDSIKAGIDNAS